MVKFALKEDSFVIFVENGPQVGKIGNREESRRPMISQRRFLSHALLHQGGLGTGALVFLGP